QGFPELRIAEGVGVVLPPDEHLATHQPVAEQADEQRVHDRGDEDQGEHGHERPDERPRTPGPPGPALNRRGPDGARCCCAHRLLLRVVCRVIYRGSTCTTAKMLT